MVTEWGMVYYSCSKDLMKDQKGRSRPERGKLWMPYSGSVFQKLEISHYATSSILFQIYVGPGGIKGVWDIKQFWTLYHYSISYIHSLLSSPSASRLVQILMSYSLLNSTLHFASAFQSSLLTLHRMFFKTQLSDYAAFLPIVEWLPTDD